MAVRDSRLCIHNNVEKLIDLCHVLAANTIFEHKMGLPKNSLSLTFSMESLYFD